VGAGVLALALVWFVATHPTHDGLWTGLVIRLLPSAVLMVAALLLLVVHVRRRPGPVAFVLAGGGRAFRAQPAGRAVWWPTLMAVALTANVAGFAVSTWEHAGELEWQQTIVEGAVVTVLGLATVALAGLSLYAVWSGWPMVELTPVGVRAFAPLGFLAVPWEALRPGYPRQPNLRAETLPLTIDRRNLARRRGLAIVPLSSLDIHPWFLADAIRYYVAHPEHRVAIGTAAEHDRLRDLLFAGGAPPASTFQSGLVQH